MDGKFCGFIHNLLVSSERMVLGEKRGNDKKKVVSRKQFSCFLVFLNFLSFNVPQNDATFKKP